MAYTTKYDGNSVEDAWDAPDGKWFEPLVLEIPDNMSAEQAFKNVKILSKIY